LILLAFKHFSQLLFHRWPLFVHCPLTAPLVKIQVKLSDREAGICLGPRRRADSAFPRRCAANNFAFAKVAGRRFDRSRQKKDVPEKDQGLFTAF
jgi:hypothetical protein